MAALAASLAAAGAPQSSDPAATARQLLPRRFVAYETGRFVLFSDAGQRWTAEQGQHLERAHHQFRRFCRRLGLEPRPLRHKLVAIAFARREDYRNFASEHDHVAEPSLAGYYAPGPDRIVFYNVETNPSLEEARAALDAMRDDLAALDRRVLQAERGGRRQEAATLRDLRSEWQHHLHHQCQRVDSFAEQAATATILHEAIHQLLFHTDIQSRRIEYPLWISEGLATAFETDSPAHAFGPDHEHAPRRRQFQAMLAAGKVLPLRQLIAIVREKEPCGADLDLLYHQGYALVTWMYRFHPRELRAYLEALRSEPAGRPSGARHMELFERAFGDASRLEAAWLRYERARLEEGGPHREGRSGDPPLRSPRDAAPGPPARRGQPESGGQVRRASG